MALLAALLIADALAHATVVARYGISDKANLPFLLYTPVNAALAVLVILSVSSIEWFVLGFIGFGLVGLTVTFNKPQRDLTLDKIIWALDVAIVVTSVYLIATG